MRAISNITIKFDLVDSVSKKLEKMAKMFDGVSKQAENAGKKAEETKGQMDQVGSTKVQDTLLKVSQAFITVSEKAGIASKTFDIVKETLAEITDPDTKKLYELSQAFSDAQSTIVKATGAAGSDLKGLNNVMLNAFSKSDVKDISSVGAAVGEVNTRFGITGEQLENVTDLFVLYADNTGTDVVSSIEKVSKAMKKWGVDTSDTSTMLDKLMFASQGSGASVDTLTNGLIINQNVFKNLGYSMDQSLAMLAMMESEALSVDTVMMGLRNAMIDLIDSGTENPTEEFQKKIQGIRDMGTEAEAQKEAIEVFGEYAGPTLASAIRSGKFAINEWTAKITGSQGTLTETSAAADTLGDHWTRAANSFKGAFTTAVAPGLNLLSTSLAKVFTDIGNLLTRFPILTRALASLAVGFGVVNGVMKIHGMLTKQNTAEKAMESISTAVQTVAEKLHNTELIKKIAAYPIVTRLTVLYGGAVKLATGPLGIIVGVIAAVVGAFALFSKAAKDSGEKAQGAEESYWNMTSASRAQKDELTELNAEYMRLCDSQGASSEAAEAVRSKMEILQGIYNDTRVSIKDFIAEVEQSMSKQKEMLGTHQEDFSNIDKEAAKTMFLADKLEELALSTENAAGKKGQMVAMVGQLNDIIPDLALNYEDLIANPETVMERVKEAVATNFEGKKMTSLVNAQVELDYEVAYQTDAKKQMEYDIEELNDQLADTDRWISETVDGVEIKYENYKYKNIKDNIGDLQAAVKELDVSIAEGEAASESYGKEIGYLIDKENERLKAEQERIHTKEEMEIKALQSVQQELDELKAKYDEAYASAKSSIENTFGLFEVAVVPKTDFSAMNKDERSTHTDKVKQMEDALESQKQWLNLYQENIDKIKSKELGFNQDLISALGDGSKESMDFLNTIMVEYDKLLNTEGEDSANAYLTKMSEDYAAVQESEANWAETITKMRIDFDTEMEKIVDIMDSRIGELNMEEGAKEAAINTMANYVQGIEDSIADASAAAAAVKEATDLALETGIVTQGPKPKSGLSYFRNLIDKYAPDTSPAGAGTAGASIAMLGLPARANGTTNAPNLFMAGEQGPELIVGMQGSTVFPTSETYRILNSMRDPLRVEAPDSMTAESRSHISQEKKITLEIAGSGEINVGGQANKESILDVMINNIKPVLMNVLNQEIYEEGDACYEF